MNSSLTGTELHWICGTFVQAALASLPGACNIVCDGLPSPSVFPKGLRTTRTQVRGKDHKGLILIVSLDSPRSWPLVCLEGS